ncbi:IS110 family transposase [Paraburkholderia bengalensis]|uniref:IS110 family transposase n=1 Tax=Paraburkholderia bengalensis TaxID=2747562 RepID=A0ABU8J279_9BURK
MRANQVENAQVEIILAASLELAGAKWKIALHDGRRDRPAIHTITEPHSAARLQAVLDLLTAYRDKWSLPSDTRIVVSYEAGQDGFWIRLDIRSREPAMCAAQRECSRDRKRRAKTDRLDVIKLVVSLRAWLRGERERMHVIQVPSLQDEASRHLMRDRAQLHKEVLQHCDRMRKLLITFGCRDQPDIRQFAGRLARDDVRCYDGSPLPPELRERLLRECERLALAQEQLAALDKARQSRLPEPVRQRIHHLTRLQGVGRLGGSRLVLELFWRQFTNRRQVGACVGLVPQPYDSGEIQTDQGISKQGNARVRALLVEMAWSWIRHQPASALTQWFNQRTQGTGPNRRHRRIAIVAVARRLAIALWRYLKDGVLPDGAQLKAARASNG